MRPTRIVKVLALLLPLSLAVPGVPVANASSTSASAVTQLKNGLALKSAPTDTKIRGKKSRSTSSKARAKAKKMRAQLVRKKRAAKRLKLIRAKKKAAQVAAQRTNQNKTNTNPTPARVAQPISNTVPTESRNVMRDRAMWLWNWDSNEQVVEFAAANSVRDIFVYAHPGFSGNTEQLTKLTDLVDRGRGSGIQMWAMGGDPSWVTNPDAGTSWVDEVVGSGIFTGIHFEIEPHSQEGYWENQDERNLQFLELLSAAKQRAEGHVFELSLPWWFHTIEYGESTLDRAAIKLVDQVTIVTYNNAVAGIKENAERAVKVAREFSKPYRFASETNTVEVDWITFVGSTNSKMLETQNKVSETVKDDPLYLGFAVHEFNGWQKLAR